MLGFLIFLPPTLTSFCDTGVCIYVCACVCAEILKELDWVCISNTKVFQLQIPIEKQAKLGHVFISKLSFKIVNESEMFLKMLRKNDFSFQDRV